MKSLIYIIGLIIAFSFVIFNIDDLIWDFIYLISGKKIKAKSKRVPMEMLDTIPPKLIAIIIAAWHEDNVLEPVIDNLISTVHYPQSMYHIFLGLYPNDDSTIAVAKKLQKKYSNVHIMMNTKNGPTSKAQNLNNVISYISQYEFSHDCYFSSITIHDSEDVVHPYELKVTNFLIDRHDALQFPVFPLQRMPKWNNFFTGITSGTYADEFAENHYRIMKMRDSMSAVVPSAGTGFVLSHKIMDYYENQDMFPEDNITEDYRFSLKLAEDGFHVHYVLEKVLRLLDNGSLKWDFIATRSMFPENFKAAVRQKTRWIYGITMQSINFADLFGSKDNNINLIGRYTLYKDLKSKFGSLLILPGYAVFIYFIVSLFISLPAVYPMGTLSGWLCVFLTCIMIYRQIIRAIAINNVYGFRSVITACLMPPLMPIRFVWGNIINLTATLKAWKQYILGREKSKEHVKIKWNKTEHDFLDQHILYRYYRNIGDVLLEKQYIKPNILREMLKKSHESQRRLGDVLLENNIINEEQLMTAVAAAQHKLFVKNVSLFVNDVVNDFDKQLLTKSLFYPLLKLNDGYVMAQTNYTPANAYDEIANRDIHIYVVYSTKERILKAINAEKRDGNNLFKDVINELLFQNKITWEQAVIAIENQLTVPDIMHYMGLISSSLIGSES